MVGWRCFSFYFLLSRTDAEKRCLPPFGEPLNGDANGGGVVLLLPQLLLCTIVLTLLLLEDGYRFVIFYVFKVRRRKRKCQLLPFVL